MTIARTSEKHPFPIRRKLLTKILSAPDVTSFSDTFYRGRRLLIAAEIDTEDRRPRRCAHDGAEQAGKAQCGDFPAVFSRQASNGLAVSEFIGLALAHLGT
jgi:hypothetical protein